MNFEVGKLELLTAVDTFLDDDRIVAISRDHVKMSDNNEWVQLDDLSEERRRFYDSLYHELSEEVAIKRDSGLTFLSFEKDEDRQVTIKVLGDSDGY